jgi:hypothetical protein
MTQHHERHQASVRAAKAAALLLATIVLFALTACGEGDMSSQDAGTSGDTSTDRTDASISEDGSPDVQGPATDGQPPEDGDTLADVQSDAGDSSSPPPPVPLTQGLIDEAVELGLPNGDNPYSLGGGGNYGKNGPVMLYLAIAGRNDPTATSSDGASVVDRAVEHMKAALSAEYYPSLPGGHSAWFDLHIPLALAIARHTPEMWSQFSAEDRERADLLMEQCLYVGNLFCNTNSDDSKQRSLVFRGMYGGSGYLPNQSGPFHAYAVGAYIYFGGTAAINALLTSFDMADYRARLKAKGYTRIDEHFDNADNVKLFNGESGDDYDPDPLGVKKPLNEMNTASLEGSPAGMEEKYSAQFSPLPAKPVNFFLRWGHEYVVGAMPLGNVGPSKGEECGPIDLKLVSGTMPYEGQGKGMPYEFNARSNVGGRVNRSSFHYVTWGMQQYMFMYATLAVLGYWDLGDSLHLEIQQRVQRAVEIFRYVGEHKWISNAGPENMQCNGQNHDAYFEFGGLMWAQDLMDAMVFSGAALPSTPAAP